ncbi:hypothetical protein WCD74_06365 [Actinomycetospora sp. OC33-EN08]|uniref:Uncharacterized protein n=1 Tax=Actinomycetospora aurantiaca TaxID=3129233 RepID=A0ABU8MLT5_9PSEU
MADDGMLNALLGAGDSADVLSILAQHGLAGLDFGQLTDLLVGAGIDQSTLTDAQIDRISGALGSHTDPVHFAGGRWEGVDQWGNPVQQSPGTPPTDQTTGKLVNPRTITWNS